MARFFPATLELVGTALFVAVIVGVPLGVWSASRQNSWVDHVSRGVSVAGVSMPLFWLGVVALTVLYGRLGWVPGSGRLSPFALPPPTVTGLYTVDALIAGDWATFVDAVRHLVLPAGCLAFVHVGLVARQVRSNVLEVLSQDYIRTAQAYGVPPRRVLYRHALRNSLVPDLDRRRPRARRSAGRRRRHRDDFRLAGHGQLRGGLHRVFGLPRHHGLHAAGGDGLHGHQLVVDLLTLKLDPRIRAMG